MPTSNNAGPSKILRDPRYNRGTAFTLAERDALGITGFFPEAVDTLDIQIFEASIHVAVKVAERIFEDNLAGVPRPADLEAHIRDWAYHPEYPPYE
jgi:hypothetical protein